MPRSLGLINRLLPPSGRETYPVSTSLGEVHHRCVGLVSNSRGIGSCVSGTPSFVGQSNSYVSDFRQGEVPSSVRGSSISTTEKVIEDIPLTQLTPGFYSRLFLVPKKTGGMRPAIDLSILSSYLSVPHFKWRPTDLSELVFLYSSRYVDYQTGPFECLFPYPNFFGFQEISPIFLEQQGLPVSDCPVWPGGCTTCFYSGFPNGYSSLAYSVGSSSFLSGRFSSEGI